ncbi:hypothetical protein PTSG_07910 [Salpingoeca rosetta]|uniref:GH29D-like beta-sandwich domain-containing protein n=1 Tax=Salpingoeca rosetta (strain ATCC 50818 / BSB-021) TaxID=946362 RepID=F2UGP2_SALR5|nr:uncharacterized protein PTSG_07910 [Salpingoeca rosetta]EGD75792.1 hypothetical protein PTSG_07910 [Salpingoeca rosetta]|eukprot:XP_004991713.1 hypothetical protein PTSG_07910 [Salpingoeca rosetta]
MCVRASLVLLTVAVCVCLCACDVHATTYYVSPAHGSDSNHGKSPSKPWKTLAKASSHRFVSGDSLLLERGGRFHNETLFIAPVDGFVLGDYGSANLSRPTIVHYRPSTKSYVNCVELVDVDNAVVRNIHLAGCFIGLQFSFTPGRNHSNVLVDNCHLRDLHHPYESYQPSDPQWARAISVVGSGGGAFVSNFTVQHTTATRIDTFFGSGGVFISGLNLDSNTVAQCGGNCYGLSGGTDMHITNSVFLRDAPETLFLYGTTDVIIGTISGDNSIEDCDFNTRGEYEAGPDGCAIDFETSAMGFAIRGNTIYRSWGGGIMVFGHATTSHGFNISDNTFVYAGCVQPRDDKAGIAFMCPGGHKPSGLVSDNVFVTCDGVPAMFDAVKGCSNNVTKINNSIDGTAVVEQPQITFSPPPPTSNATRVTIPALAVTRTANATIRYTLDGSRPTTSSPVVPAGGVAITWPGPDIVMNVRAFHAGMRPSITNGVVIERSLYRPRGSAGIGYVRSNLDALTVNASSGGEAWVRGWAVDTSLPGLGREPVTVRVDVDLQPVAYVVASLARPDLVAAGVAPDPNHGFNLQLSGTIARSLLSGNHIVDVFVVDSPMTRLQPTRVALSPMCTCNGVVCPC